jgi:hypothetical protein
MSTTFKSYVFPIPTFLEFYESERPLEHPQPDFANLVPLNIRGRAWARPLTAPGGPSYGLLGSHTPQIHATMHIDHIAQIHHNSTVQQMQQSKIIIAQQSEHAKIKFKSEPRLPNVMDHSPNAICVAYSAATICAAYSAAIRSASAVVIAASYSLRSLISFFLPTRHFFACSSKRFAPANIILESSVSRANLNLSFSISIDPKVRAFSSSHLRHASLFSNSFFSL